MIIGHLKRLTFGVVLASLFLIAYLKVDSLRAFEPGTLPAGSKLLVLIFPDSEFSAGLFGWLMIPLGYLLFDEKSKASNSILALSLMTACALWADVFAELPDQILIRHIWPGYEKWGPGIYLDEIAFPLFGILLIGYFWKKRSPSETSN